VLIPEVYDRQKHPFTTPPTRRSDDPMLGFYRDTFASRAAREQPLYDMDKVSAALDRLLDCPDDQRIAIEGSLQRVASAVVMHERFGMA
jgi:asparagine synthase (glutamine-hydrolysing)